MSLPSGSEPRQPIKAALRSLLPRSAFDYLRARRRRFMQRAFTTQGLTTVTCGRFTLEAPSQHILTRIAAKQPYRDLCLGVAARYVAAKYPAGSILDIGANIGDSAAIIATNAPNKLILVEGSDFFYEFLTRNAARLPNVTVLKNALVSDGTVLTGFLHHWEGTAAFHEEPTGEMRAKSERLADLADADTCFVKTDVDGYDFKVLLGGMDWIASQRPAVFFEDQIRNEQDLSDANELCGRLADAGYAAFVVWDDAGLHVASTRSLETLRDLNRYQFKLWQRPGRQSIHNYDVLCLHARDEDVYEKVQLHAQTY